MSTGVESFTVPTDVGPLYPFVGLESLMFVAAVVLWVLWHVLQIRSENREYDEALSLYKQMGLSEALHQGGAAVTAKLEQVREQMLKH